jgi:hypothetical protein
MYSILMRFPILTRFMIETDGESQKLTAMITCVLSLQGLMLSSLEEAAAKFTNIHFPTSLLKPKSCSDADLNNSQLTVIQQNSPS